MNRNFILTPILTARVIRSKFLSFFFCATALVQLNLVKGQCPTIIPTVADTCVFGSQILDLTASGSSGSYAWYTAATGGSFIGNGSPFSPGQINITSTYYVAAQESNYALDFDGNNDRIAIQNYNYASSGNTGLTVEAWVKTTSNSNMVIASFDSDEYWSLGISNPGTTIGRASWSVNTNNGVLDVAGSTVINDGQWHHVSGTFDTFFGFLGRARIYVDGVLDATSFQFFGTSWGSGTARYGFVGVGSQANSFNGATDSNNFFDGEIDEVRVWSTTRSGADILNNKDNCLLGTEAGLELYYKFNDGPSSGSVTDQVSNNNGTLISMNANNDWMPNDALYSCPSCESARADLDVTINNGTPVSISGSTVGSCQTGLPVLDAGAGYNSYLWSTGATSQTISANATGLYSVTVDQGGCFSKDSVFVNIDNGNAQTSANFDGNNDYVAIQGLTYQTNSLTSLTVEAWVKTNEAGNQIIASFDRSDYWRLGINGNGAGNGQVAWNLRTSAGILDFGSTTRVDDGEWHHVVGTYNSGLASIYIDGVLDATANSGTSIGSGNLRYGFIGTGSEANTFNGSRGPNAHFEGEIEELKIWHRALSLNEIRTNMCQNLTGANTDLMAYFKFNEGNGVQVQSEIATVSAQAFNVNTNSFWENSGAPIGDKSLFLYPSSWSGNSLVLQSCSNTEFTVSNISGSAEGLHLYVIEGDPDNLTGIDSFTLGNHYYGVFYPKSATPTYTAEIDYTNHPLITANNAFGAVALERNNKTAATFAPINGSNDIVNEVLSFDEVGRREFIVDSKYYRWTGNTNTNWAVASNWEPSIVPPANASIIIPDVVNQPILDIDRTQGSVKLNANSTVNLDGHELDHKGNLIADGVIISAGGEITFSSTSPQQLFLGVPQLLDFLTATNPTEVSLSGESLSILHTLTVQNGTFNTNDSLILVSNDILTARIDELTGGGIVNGEIEMQRYIDAGETYWRFFSSAVEGATVGDYQGDFVTSGYVGSDFPNFPFTSVYTYIEGTGYAAVSNANQVIQQGQGLMVWSGDTITGTDPFVVDYRGVPNQGDINMPVSLTNNDGWNLVGNPYPSTINWDSPEWTKTNMANAVYILDPDTRQYTSYVNGASANGGSPLIASQQAFWVGALANNPVLTATEGVKSIIDQPNFKTTPDSSISPGMSILLAGNNMTDEAVVRHASGATDSYDSNFDAVKRFATWAEYPHISVLNGAGEDYTIHSFDKGFQEWELPIRTIVFQNGVYDLVFSNLHELNVPCLKLEDTYNGQMYDLVDGVPLSFNMSDTTYAPRFILHIGKNYELVTSQPQCNGQLGSIIIGVDSLELGTYQIVGPGTNRTESFNGSLEIDSLPAGNYAITVNGLVNNCQTNQFNIDITEPTPLLLKVAQTPETFGQDGSITVKVIGGVAPYQYLWSNSVTDSLLTGLSAGTYSLNVTDANGCEISGTYTLNSVLNTEEQAIKTEFKHFRDENRIYIAGQIDATYQLVDMVGKVVATYQTDDSSNEVTLWLPKHLAKGTYVLAGKEGRFTLVK